MNDSGEPILDVAQLAHVELLTPKPDETLWFFQEFLALTESGREGQSVYLRAYEDFYHHTLKVTEAAEAGLGHIGWRARSARALERRAGAIEAIGLGHGWVDGDVGHGPAYWFQTPDGHAMEVFWDVEYHEAPPEHRSRLRNRPQKRPSHGVPARRLDHVNCFAANVRETADFMTQTLGFRLTETILMDEDEGTLASWLTVTNLAHDIAFFQDPTGARGRFHHVCYWYGTPQHLNDLVDLLKDAEIEIEAGPGKHGITQGYYLYVFEPGGNRVELWGDAGLLIFDPAWKTVVWRLSESATTDGGTWIGDPIVDTFYSRGTPQVESVSVGDGR